MATVYQKRGTWYGAFKDEAGRRRAEPLPARGKTEAKRLVAELEQQAWRRRHGLEASPGDSRRTLGELCDWWLKSRCPPRSRARERCRLQRYIITKPIGELPLPQVTPAVVEELLCSQEASGLSGATANHTRATLRNVFNRARKAGIWTGPNPAAEVERRREARKVFPTLRAEDVPELLPWLSDRWRPLFAAALYTAMRRGELLGLRKCDVDLEGRTITVCRSWGFDTTKGGHGDVIPIAEPLLPYLRAAMEASPSELVFPRPGPKGEMYRPDVALEDVLRAALGRARLLLDGYDHVCRRCKARKQPEHSWRHPDDEERRCPTCGMRLWPRAAVRPMRFHDLRHTTATLLFKADVPAHKVQRILRHKSITTTTGTYGHLVVEDLRDALTKLPAPAAEVPAQAAVGAPAPPAGAEASPDATRELPGAPAAAARARAAAEKAQAIRAHAGARQGRLERPTYGLEVGAPGLPRGSQPFAAREKSGTSLGARSPHVTGVQPPSEGFCYPGATRPQNLRLVGGPQRLLSVRAVAEQLNVCTATVYALCAAGELAHVRISNALRIAPADLEAFLAGQRRGGRR